MARTLFLIRTGVRNVCLSGVEWLECVFEWRRVVGTSFCKEARTTFRTSPKMRDTCLDAVSYGIILCVATHYAVRLHTNVRLRAGEIQYALCFRTAMPVTTLAARLPIDWKML